MAKIPQNEPTDYSQPVAYDKQGRPLYAHPPQESFAGSQASEQHPPVVYMTRPAEPLEQHISEAAKKRHEEAKRLYPALNLSDGEYVISEVRRHPIGLFSIWFIVAVILAVVFIGGPLFIASVAPDFISNLEPNAVSNGLLFLVFLVVFFVLAGVVATVIYLGNRFYLTNESVIQRIQHDLLSHKEQTVSLANVEDASYNIQGLIQMIFHFGSIQVKYRGRRDNVSFSFVADPKRQVDLLNNAVEAFKNGRPVDTMYDN